MNLCVEIVRRKFNLMHTVRQFKVLNSSTIHKKKFTIASKPHGEKFSHIEKKSGSSSQCE